MLEILFGFIIIIVASLIIMKACDYFELATDYLGRNMSDGIKGATIQAVGSSFPEFLTTIFFLIGATDPSKLGINLSASISGDSGLKVGPFLQ